MKKITFLFTLSIIATMVIAQNQVKPTCDNLKGTWKNELKSSLIIESIDQATGQITGKYISPSGAGTATFPLTGWVNDSTPMPKQDHAKVISFTVRWGTIGRITSWTGVCESDKIFTVWNLAMPNSGYTWDHLLTGSDTFKP